MGLTGGIGSGKTEVARRLAERGAVVIDADRLAREVVEPGTAGLAAVVAEFGADVLAPDGRLDRARLGEIVFADADRLARLNAIVHPRVAERTAELMAAAPEDAIVVYDVPLLVENDLGREYDVVVVVDAPDDLRVGRVVANRGMGEEQARARIRAQASREERLAAADVVVDNSGTVADLDARVAEVWAGLAARAGAGSSAS
ncbi:dephospho-CoA kinase [Marinitenerispora sediminis]|uniref:Dephospho-CoA kinase n=1 Tax=Marinitenerispora sediminis TaxID=1931232 RepID=A0A368TD60_9ACTN|nr:dephospho-CoA kinase [Marinitenerispora sediminis]RCV59464.1 dephospho-CoA kinase [Marinitenerispora sediminis]RCV61701.1 dephospho-CoA kinase [Marinitenerispora sediminis]